VPGITNDCVAGVGKDTFDRERVNDPPEESGPASEEGGNYSNSAPARSTIPMPNSHAIILAVVNDAGYLLPIFTAADMLRQCKAAWRAAQDYELGGGGLITSQDRIERFSAITSAAISPNCSRAASSLRPLDAGHGLAVCPGSGSSRAK